MLRERTSANSSISYAREMKLKKHNNLASSLLILGGLLWIIHYILQIIAGTIGIHAMSLEISFGFIEGILFSSALICLNTGLIKLNFMLVAKSEGWAYAGLAFSIIALTGTIAGFLINVLAGGHVGILGAIGVIGSCIGATLLAIGALRSKMLLLNHALLLLLIGIFTFPLIVILATPLSVPAYFTDGLPFAVSGLAWLVFGVLYKEYEKKRNYII